jgi:hypothetical protein
MGVADASTYVATAGLLTRSIYMLLNLFISPGSMLVFAFVKTLAGREASYTA